MKNITKSTHTRADVQNAYPAATPIYQNSAFEAQSDYFYTRLNNPNVAELEDAIRILEKTEFGLATTTGMSALQLSLSLLKPGQRILVNKHVYGCSFKLIQWYTEHYGLELFVSDLSLDTIDNQLSEMDMVFFETPTNPFLRTIDISKVSKHFKQLNPKCLVVVDNTWATPLYQSPCSLGGDISIHSATKYISGHSDVMGGILLTNREDLAQELRTRRFYTGANLDPNSAWLLRRSLHTLDVRLERQAINTKRLVEYLETKNEVHKVYYPKVDGTQLTKYATLIFMDLDAKIIQNYSEFCSHLKLFSTGTGMACVTSMIAQPFTGSHASMEECEKEDMGLDKSTIRLSFGMEDPEDLIDDLENAFVQIKSL
ncbi:MAG: trans-sulfuration enzyme family protein [Salibacteraceae bacterium]